MFLMQVVTNRTEEGEKSTPRDGKSTPKVDTNNFLEAVQYLMGKKEVDSAKDKVAEKLISAIRIELVEEKSWEYGYFAKICDWNEKYYGGVAISLDVSKKYVGEYDALLAGAGWEFSVSFKISNNSVVLTGMENDIDIINRIVRVIDSGITPDKY